MVLSCGLYQVPPRPRTALAELLIATFVMCASPVGLRVRISARIPSGALEDLPWLASSEILGLYESTLGV
jgi:hypothetical protein